MEAAAALQQERDTLPVPPVVQITGVSARGNSALAWDRRGKLYGMGEGGFGRHQPNPQPPPLCLTPARLGSGRATPSATRLQPKSPSPISPSSSTSPLPGSGWSRPPAVGSTL